MNDHPEPPSYAIGACLNCRHIYLLTPSQRDCPLCMGPPRLWAPFGGVEQRQWGVSDVELQKGEAVTEITVHGLPCPACSVPLMVVMNDQDVTLALEPREEPAAAAAEGAGKEQPEEAAPAGPLHCPHREELGEFCDDCLGAMGFEESEATAARVLAAKRLQRVAAAQPSDPGLAEDVQRLGVAVEELSEKMPLGEEETSPAEDVERLPAAETDGP